MQIIRDIKKLLKKINERLNARRLRDGMSKKATEKLG